jgi:type I restriction enzyme, S subunit
VAVMAGKYQTYPEYKDSGTHWIGMIPKQWDVKKAKHLFRLETGGTPSTSDDENFDENGITWVKPDNLNEFIPVTSTQRHVSESGVMGIPIIPKGSILVCGIGTVGKFGIAGADLITNQQINAFIPDSRFIDQKFAKYLIASSGEQLAATANKVVVAISNKTSMQNILLCIPLKSEQQQIANFLDHETAKIDTLIEKQQQLIQLLKEKRQAVISHAVTKGLNPDVPMRDSGVEWLGEVPEHWEIRAISKLSNKITNGFVGPTRDILVEDGIPYIQATHIKNGKVNFDGAYYVRKTWSEAHAKSILAKGDVLIVQTGAGTGDVGLVSNEEVGFNCHALIIVQPNRHIIVGDYLSMILQSQYGYSVLYSIRTGGMHPHLNCSEIQYVKLPVPPLIEQDQIIRYIQVKTSTYDSLIEKQTNAIFLMQERRTALIAAAVTGKIDVRNWVAPAHP